MLTQTALVTKTQEYQARVRFDDQRQCARCASNGGCQGGVISKLFPRAALELNLVNSLAARVGQRVRVGIHERLLLSAVWAVYGLPLIIAVGVALLVHLVLRQVLSAGWVDFLVLLSAAGIGLSVLKFQIKRLESMLCDSDIVMVEVLPGSAADTQHCRGTPA